MDLNAIDVSIDGGLILDRLPQFKLLAYRASDDGFDLSRWNAVYRARLIGTTINQRRRKIVPVLDASLAGVGSKFGGMDVSDAQKLKALEDENRKLKRLLAEVMLDVAMLKDL